MPPLNIAVVGGGVGGPCAAIGLAQNGHNVTVYERLTPEDSVGFAFRITPNSNRCLKFLGIDSMEGGAVSANSGRMMTSGGKLIAEFKENVDLEKANKGASVFAFRSSLQRQLVDRMAEAGVTLKTSRKVTSVDVDKITLTFDDGSIVSADLIIAADGVHSTIRPSIVDTSIYYPKCSTSHNCLRFMISKDAMFADPVASKSVDDDYKMFQYKGGEKRIIGYAVDHGRQYNINATHPAKLSSRETSHGDNNSAEAVGESNVFLSNRDNMLMNVLHSLQPLHLSRSRQGDICRI